MIAIYIGGILQFFYLNEVVADCSVAVFSFNYCIIELIMYQRDIDICILYIAHSVGTESTFDKILSQQKM